MSFRLNLDNLTPTYALVKGHVLHLQTGLVVVPFQDHKTGRDCVVVKGNKTYPIGGYNIYVFHDNLLAAERLELS